MKKNGGLAWVLSLSMILYHRLCEAWGVGIYIYTFLNINKGLLVYAILNSSFVFSVFLRYVIIAIGSNYRLDLGQDLAILNYSLLYFFFARSTKEVTFF